MCVWVMDKFNEANIFHKLLTLENSFESSLHYLIRVVARWKHAREGEEEEKDKQRREDEKVTQK